MPTGKKYANFTVKRLLGKTDFSDRIFSYLLDAIKELSASYYTTDYVVGSGIEIGAPGDDRIGLADLGANVRGIDGVGNILNPFSEDGLYPMRPYSEDIPFENEDGVNYHIALHHAALPSAGATNPRTGYPDIIEYEDIVGFGGVPGTVEDNGDGTITINVEALVNLDDYTGRKAWVYQPVPAKGAVNPSIGQEECEIWQDGAVAKITTVGSLGQTTISTNPADYMVVIPGPVVTRYFTPESAAGYVYIGYVTGNGPAATPDTFVTTNQRVLPTSLPSLFFDGMPTDLYPRTDNTYNLGTPDLRWANIYLVNFNIGANLVPASHNAYDIGNSGTRWRDLFLGRDLYVAGKVKSDFVPGSTADFDLGDPDYRWGNLYAHGSGIVDIDSVTAPSILGGNMPAIDRDGGYFDFNKISSLAFWKSESGVGGPWTYPWSAVNSVEIESGTVFTTGIHGVKAIYPGDTKIRECIAYVQTGNGSSASNAALYDPGDWDLSTIWVGENLGVYLIMKDTLVPNLIYDRKLIPASSLPSGAGQHWVPIASCSDGNSLYIMFMDFAEETWADVKFRVQAYSLKDDGTSNATVKALWPATGIEPASGSANINSETAIGNTLAMLCKIIVCDNNHIATTNCWVDADVNPPACPPIVSIINKADGTIASEGCGDLTSAFTGIRTSVVDIASDGTLLMFTAASGWSNFYVGSALISDATADPGQAMTPFDLATLTGMDWKAAQVFCNGDSFLFVNTEPVANGLNSNFALAVVPDSVKEIGSALHKTPPVDHVWAYRNAIFDGMNFWFFVQTVIDGDPLSHLILQQVRPCNVRWEGDQDVDDIEVQRVVIDGFEELQDDMVLAGFKGFCDGKYLWITNSFYNIESYVVGTDFVNAMPSIVRRIPLTQGM